MLLTSNEISTSCDASSDFSIYRSLVDVLIKQVQKWLYMYILL